MINFEELADKTKKSIIIKNSRVFTNPDHIPQNIYKVKQVNKILKNVANFVYHGMAFHTIILGGKGVGKTVSLRHIADMTNSSEQVNEKISEQYPNQKADFVLYINCKENNGLIEIMREMITIGGGTLKSKVGVRSQFKDFFKNKKLVIILDEVDYIRYLKDKKSTSIFNLLSVTNTNSVEFSLVAITNDVKWLESMREQDADFEAKYYISDDNKISWQKPTQNEIYEILKLRLDEAVEGEVADEYLQEIAALTFSKYGSNVRIGILTLGRVLIALEKGAHFDIPKIMAENAIGMIMEGLKNMRLTDLVILYLMSYYDNTSDILQMYNLFVEQTEQALKTVTRPTLLTIFNNLQYQNYITLYKGTSRKPDHVELIVPKELIEDVFRDKFGEEVIETIAMMNKNYKDIKSETKNKKLDIYK